MLAAALLASAPVAHCPAQPAASGASIAEIAASWTPVDADPRTFRLEDGVLRVGDAGGWLRSRRRYADFRLTAELRFVTGDADSGIFVRAEPGAAFGRGWPADSYQVQLRNPLGDSPFPPVGGLFRHGPRGGSTRFDEAAARAAFTGTGEWQTVSVRVEGDTLRVGLNGVAVTEADGIANATGFVGIQSETGVVEIRSIEIAPL